MLSVASLRRPSHFLLAILSFAAFVPGDDAIAEIVAPAVAPASPASVTAVTYPTSTRWADFRANPYWRDRWLDFADMFGLRVSGASKGRGAGVLVRATALAQLGAVTFDGEHAGLDRRAFGVWRERRLQGAIGPFAFTRIRVKNLSGNEFAGPDSDWARATPRGIIREGEYWDDGRERPFAFGVELQPGVLPGFEARFDPLEMVDFLLGWATLDIYDDDLEAPADLPEEAVQLPNSPLDFNLPPRPGSTSGAATGVTTGGAPAHSHSLPATPALPSPPASEAETLPELERPEATTPSRTGLLQDSREESEAPPPVSTGSHERAATSHEGAAVTKPAAAPGSDESEPLETETFSTRVESDWMKPPARAVVPLQELEEMGVKEPVAVPEAVLAKASANSDADAATSASEADGPCFRDRVRGWFRRVFKGE